MVLLLEYNIFVLFPPLNLSICISFHEVLNVYILSSAIHLPQIYFQMKLFLVAYTSPSEVAHTCITQAYTIAHILNIPLASTLHNLNLHLISQGYSINPLISANIIDTPLSPFWIQCNVHIHIISHPRTLLITSTIHLIVLQEQLFS